MTTRRKFITSSLAAGAMAIGAKRIRAQQHTKFSAYPFSLGVASGYPSEHSMVLWTRLAPAPLRPDGGMPQAIVPVRWEVATDSNMKTVVKQRIDYAMPEWAHSLHVGPQGLEPGREYWYRFTAGDARSPIGRTATAPPSGAAVARLRLAVASCQDYE